MVKSIISSLCALIILFAASYGEGAYIKNTFDDFSIFLVQTNEKLEKQTASTQDALALQNFWKEKKRVLHIFIPHNEIKEIDLWLAEAVKPVKNEKWEDALSKIEVLKELLEQIPKTFALSIENVF